MAEQPSSDKLLAVEQMQGPPPSVASPVEAEGAVAPRGWLHSLPSARAAWLRYAAAVVIPGFISLAGAIPEEPDPELGSLLYLLGVAVVAAIGGLLPALVATGLSAVALEYYFRSPSNQFAIGDAMDVVALALFLVAAVLISELLARQRRAYALAERAAARVTRLQSVTQELVDARTRADVLDVILEHGVAASGAARGLVALVREEDRELEIVASRGYDQAVLDDWRRFPIDAELPLSEAARTGEPVHLRSAAHRDERFPQLRRGGVRPGHALVALPLLVEGRALGGLALSFAEDRVFDPGERALMDAIGRQCAQAFERARLLEAEQRARRELARQKALLEAESEASADGILLVTPEGQIAAFNHRFVELWGIPDDIVERRSDAEALKFVESKLVDPREFFDRISHLYAHHEEESRDEIELLDGRILDRYSAPARGDDGTYHGRVWYFRDVTEQRRREEIASFLAEASEILSSTRDHEAAIQQVVRLPIPRLVGVFTVSVFDERGHLRLLAAAHADPEKERLLHEIDRRYGSGAPQSPLQHALEARQSIAIDRPDADALRPFVVDDEHLRLLLEVAPSAGILVPLLAGRRVHGALGMAAAPGRSTFPEWKRELAHEIARRIAIAIDNARLYREVERRADAARALAQVAESVLLVDREGLIRYWNPAAAEALGLDDAALGERAEVVVPGWAVLGAEPRARPGTVSRTIPVELDGEERWLAASRVDFEEGSVFALRDVTEERTLERMRTEFVSTASHQLRTPLAAVYGAARTLLDRQDVLPTSDRDTFLKIIVSESERLIGIVEDILLADYLSAGTLELDRQRCDARPVALDVVGAARPTLPERLALRTVLPDRPQFVIADEEKLRQVLANLVDNAVKYSADGGEIEVAVESSNSRCRFAVRDRGPGIPAPERERIFEKFFRLDPHLRQGIAGTGLGLYICRELSERMGGRVWVEPREGGGSVFFVELPAA